MWVPISEAAQTLKLSKRSIWRMLKTGALKSKKEGRQTLIQIEMEKEDISETLNSNNGERIAVIFDALESLHFLRDQAAYMVEGWEGFTKFRNEGIRKSGQEKMNFWIGIQETLNSIYKKLEEANSQMDHAELKSLFTQLLETKSLWEKFISTIIRKEEGIVFTDMQEQREHRRELDEMRADLKDALSHFTIVQESIKELLSLSSSI